MSITTTPKATLENWSMQEGPPRAGDIYRAPETVGPRKHLHADHPIKPGMYFTTSRIVESDGRLVQTKSGSVYRLGEPDPEWLAWMADNGIDFDPSQPITIR